MLLHLIEILLFAYLAACVLYNLVLSVAGRLARKKKPATQAADVRYARIAILVPAYREDAIILSTARSYAKQSYPAASFETIVVADSLQPATVRQLKQDGISVVEVSFDKSTKAKSLNAAFEQLGDDYDIALICDADNVLETSFLEKINQAYQQGHHAIQGRRVAKNMDSPFAVLDAVNEIVANHLYRKGANALGLSSSVIGSGMAFHYPLAKSVLKEIQATGGFDKVLQLLLIEKGYPVYYLEDACIFDEKVESSEAFQNQRKRWVSSQFVYLRTYWGKGWAQLWKGNVNYFNLAVCQNILLPRMILLAGLLCCTALAFLLQRSLSIPAWWWAVVFLLNILSLLLPLPRLFFTRYFFTALTGLPKAVWIMVSLMFRLKGANNTFIHTQHTKTEIDNPLLDAARK
ncbi:glycosyltransferase family 2 protein [Chitinophaga varians]|uniref:Glycosyltransferase family 2 protein n=1 Tax=Chitinophaga varians TaxID=2202339 RepID=A0A847SBS4_9BACT|nr:glycosyltransferase family 2 protein [Chitinophaga varians]NLR69121.1 glycosyltransferase family 2 protein [Chitinophaga varians]